jgi:NADH:ubiquinone oxidoreductase subunit K
MSENRTVSIVLFVLGLILISVGIGLSNVSQTNITLQGRITAYPYLSAGAAYLIIGTVVLVVAYLIILFKRTPSTPVKTPETNKPRSTHETQVRAVH